jgi:hypothetical protein
MPNNNRSIFILPPGGHTLKWQHELLLQIGAQGADEIVRGSGLFVCRASILGKNVIPNVPFNDLGHERVHCAATGRNVVKDVGAFRFLIERLLNRGDLAHDSTHSVQQLLFFFNGVSHKIFKIFSETLYEDTPAGIFCLWGLRNNPSKFLRQ